MKNKELMQKSEAELKKMIYLNKEKMREFRFDLVSGKIKNVNQIKKTRREIARILTILNKKR